MKHSPWVYRQNEVVIFCIRFVVLIHKEHLPAPIKCSHVPAVITQLPTGHLLHFGLVICTMAHITCLEMGEMESSGRLCILSPMMLVVVSGKFVSSCFRCWGLYLVMEFGHMCASKEMRIEIKSYAIQALNNYVYVQGCRDISLFFSFFVWWICILIICLPLRLSLRDYWIILHLHHVSYYKQLRH